MAAEVELQRMVVRLVGDTVNYVQSLDKAYTLTQQTASKIGGVTFVTNFNMGGQEGGFAKVTKDAKDTEEQVRRLNLSMGDMRKSMVLMSTIGIIDPQAGHMVFIAVQGFGLLKTAIVGAYTALKALEWSTFRTAVVDAFSAAKTAIAGMVTALFTAQGALTALKVALISTGIGAIVVALGTLVAWLTKLSQEFTAAKESAGSAFQSVVTGARTAQQAIADVRINTLTEGAKELQDVINPGFWRSIWNGLQNVVGLDAVERKFNDIVARARQAEQLFQRLQNDPRMQTLQREIANRRNAQSSRDVAVSLEEEAERAGMAANEAKRYAEAQKYAREASISLEAALSRLAASHSRQRAAEMTIEVGRLTIQLRDLNDEADRSGLTEITNRLTAMVQQFWRANPAVGTFADAMQRLQPILEGTRQALVRQQFGEFQRGLQDQINVIGLSTERAQLFRMQLDGLGESQTAAGLATIRHLEAVRALQGALEALQGTRAGSTEALHRIAEYNRQFELATAGATARQRLLQQQQQGIPSPTGPASLTGSASAAGLLQGVRTTQQILTGIPQLPGSLVPTTPTAAQTTNNQPTVIQLPVVQGPSGAQPSVMQLPATQGQPGTGLANSNGNNTVSQDLGQKVDTTNAILREIRTVQLQLIHLLRTAHPIASGVSNLRTLVVASANLD